tara:strand:+ start:1266 stop:1439 length:174 start_codon:yes stop_codon:yes gene_type:complete
MGKDLADNRNDFIANGWARNLAEAILWHSEEAEKSRDFLLQLPSKNREALIAFLESF